MKDLRGTGVALITPFRDYAVDYDALDRCIEFVIAGKVDYIVSLGSTGECVTLSPTERRSVLTQTIKTVAGRVPVVAGNFGENDTRRLCDYVDRFNFEGVTAILSSSPAYNKPTQEGIYQHYKFLAKHSPVPVILYNVPGRTGSNVTADTTIRLARDCPNITGIKEASGDLEQAKKIISAVRDDFLVVSGDDPTALGLIEAGGDGVISVIANGFPRAFSAMVSNALAGNTDHARKINALLDPIHPLLYVEGNPAGIKGVTELRELSTREVRLPLTALTPTTFTMLKTACARVASSSPEYAW